ncbi:MAG: 2-amino-4-hydroxy-6-hydroxymethyldihydropteridine diphosphokinase [Kiritimatiellia bacterium]
MARVVIALGSNLGDREAILDFAVSALSALPKTQLLRTAKRYETAPVDVPPAFEKDRFLNSAVLLETSLLPYALLEALHHIEHQAGRIRTIRNGPRTLDLDIILYEGVTMNSAELTLPHPRAHLRAFVCIPLSDLGITIDALKQNRIETGV